MKKVAVTVAVLTLGLAACQKNAQENAAGNETAVENTAEVDTNAAAVDATNAADAALDNVSNDVNAVGTSDNTVNTSGNAY